MPSPLKRRVKEVARHFESLLSKYKSYPVFLYRGDILGSRYWRSFLKIFLLSKQFDVEPRYWIEVQFERLKHLKGTPVPTMMCSENAINYFVKEHPENVKFSEDDKQNLYKDYLAILKEHK